MKIYINADSHKVKEIKKALKKNNGYCPTADIQDRDYKCMCREFREQTKPGYCRCGLYYKGE